MTGTLISSITGDTPMRFMGMDVYAVQFTTLMRGVSLFAIGWFCMKQWRLLTRDADIAEIETMERQARANRRARRRI